MCESRTPIPLEHNVREPLEAVNDVFRCGFGVPDVSDHPHGRQARRTIMTLPADAERWRAMEARLDALSSTVKAVLTTLVLRGVLNRAEVSALLQETEAVMNKENPFGVSELRAIQHEMPAYMRAAVGPPPDPDDDH
jgi:hypothetical protein